MPRLVKTLDGLPIGSIGTVIKIISKMRNRQKFANVGITPGAELLVEAHAPLGGLIRVKVMGASMAFHRDDAANIVIQTKGAQDEKAIQSCTCR